MPQHQIQPMLSPNFVDRQRSAGTNLPNSSNSETGQTVFTANAGGSTTTILGADATLATGVNVVRSGRRYRLYNSSGALKENTIFTVSGASSSAGTTTVTFGPAAGANTASGDILKEESGAIDYGSISALDARLTALAASTYPQRVLDSMTVNDKIYALRVLVDPLSI
jgi:hypothetical protein